MSGHPDLWKLYACEIFVVKHPIKQNKISGILTRFQTDYFISGIAPFNEYLVLLAYLEDPDQKKAPKDRVG